MHEREAGAERAGPSVFGEFAVLPAGSNGPNLVIDFAETSSKSHQALCGEL
jgi:hypothetical protein